MLFMESTDRSGLVAGLRCQLWKGTTDDGVPLTLWVAAVRVECVGAWPDQVLETLGTSREEVIPPQPKEVPINAESPF